MDECFAKLFRGPGRHNVDACMSLGLAGIQWVSVVATGLTHAIDLTGLGFKVAGKQQICG